MQRYYICEAAIIMLEHLNVGLFFSNKPNIEDIGECRTEFIITFRLISIFGEMKYLYIFQLSCCFNYYMYIFLYSCIYVQFAIRELLCCDCLYLCIWRCNLVKFLIQLSQCNVNLKWLEIHFVIIHYFTSAMWFLSK